MHDTSTYDKINSITERVLNDGLTTPAEGEWMLTLDSEYIPWLMGGADRIRKTFRGNDIDMCAISNIRSGNCSENCNFCAQSGHYKTDAPVYDYIANDDLLAQAKKAESWGVSDLGIVSKGWGMRSNKERDRIKDYMQSLSRSSKLGRCASLGVLNHDTAQELKSYGLENYHHNLETAASFFSNICTTHTYQENIDTIKHAMEAGLRVCAGGILGMGESIQQRIEFAMTLRDLNIDSVPLNFLNPQKGTPFETLEPMKPMEILKNIAVFRFMLPKAEIRIAGGRGYLKELQSMIFMSGASAIMIGDYLTTKGRAVEDDLSMFQDLNLTVRNETEIRRAEESQLK